MYKLNYSKSVPLNGEDDDCYTDEYGHSETFTTLGEMNDFIANNNIQVEDIEEL